MCSHVPDRRRAIVAAAVLLAAGNAAAQIPQPPPSPSAAPQPGAALPAAGLPPAPLPATADNALSILAVSINGRELDGSTVVAARGTAILAPAEDVARWRLRPGAAARTIIDGQPFIALSALRSVRAEIDTARQMLVVTAPPEAFETTVIAAAAPTLPPSPAIRTAFLNYDLSFEHGPGEDVAGAFLTAGASDDRGLVASSMTVGSTPGAPAFVRLDSYAIRDDPAGFTRLSIGDALTRGSSWAPPVRFGGIRYGTDFSLQPGFLSFPTPDFGGRAALPSNVEVYVNDVLNYSGQVDEGAFALDRLPLVSGAGRVSVLVRDQLGVERRVTNSYYVSTQLLRAGLSEYSLEAGGERRNYGRTSFDYARPFAAATFRRGLTDRLTVESRAEAARDVQMAGGGFASTIGALGEVAGAVAASNGPDGLGWLYRVSMARITRRWSMSLTYQASSRDFTELGLAGRDDRIRTLLQASGGVVLGVLGNINVSHAALRRADGFRTQATSLGYSRSLARNAFLNAFAVRADASDRPARITAGVGVTVTLGPRTTVNATADSRNRRLEAQRAVPNDRGWGWRAIAGQGDNSEQRGDLSYRNEVIDATAQVARYRGEFSGRLLASGSLVLAGGSVLPTRRLDNGFAIVDVGGEKGVRVFQDNRPVGRTNARGLAIVTQLRPYEANRIGVAPDDLQLDTVIRNDSMIVVPRFSSGVLARFQIGQGRAGTVLVVLPDGSPLEPGVPVAIEGVAESTDDPLFSGYGGEVFVPDISRAVTLVIRRNDGACRVAVPATPAGETLPRIGPLTCRPAEAGR